MQARHHEAASLVTTAVLAVVVALVGLGGAIRLAQSAANLGPQVGDILAFEPSRHLNYDSPPQVIADRGKMPQCVLDVGVIHRLGGSLIIESRSPMPNRIYRVHWAGQHSSNGSTDCGASAELQLSTENLDVLALAAGGYGVSHQQRAANTVWDRDDSARASH